MNTITEHDRKLAETLKSLSLEASPEQSPSPVKSIRRPALFIFMSLVGFIFLLAYVWPQSFGLPSWGAAPGEIQSALPAQQVAEARSTASAVTPPTAVSPEVSGSGYVVAPRTTSVFSKYEGTITEIAIQPGDRVKAGDVLVTLDNVGARLVLEQAKAAKAAADLKLEASEIALSQTRATFERATTLAASNAISRQTLDDAKVARENAGNGVSQARQAIAIAEIGVRVADEQVEALTIRAPFDGTVTHINAHVGDTVLARGDSVRESLSLLTLADTDHMVIDADVAESTITALHSGLRGEAILDGFPNQPFSVRIQHLAPVVSIEKGTVTLRLSLTAPPPGIRPNMAARIRIFIDQTGEKTK